MDTARHRLTVVSNRGPVQYDRVDDERVSERGAGGLVSALRGLISSHEVTWIVCAITDEDHVVAAEQAGQAALETDAAGNPFRLHFADPDPADYAAMYREIANPLLWFIQHELFGEGVEPPTEAALRAAWTRYRTYNAALAAEAVAEADCDAVMVHDYQLYLVPRMLREAGVETPISHFTHIPWPEPPAWERLPADLLRELLEGLLGADIIGLQTQRDVAGFLKTCAAVLPEARIDHEACSVTTAGRQTLVRAYPISIDPIEFRAQAQEPEMLEAHASLLRERPERLVLRVDRTDPSKNIVRGFLAYDRVLERRPDLHGAVVLLSLLDPSRLAVPIYADYLALIRETVQAINERHGRDGWLPIDLRIGDNFPVVVAAYREYDVLLVNAIADGMNLISKEAPLLNQRDGVVALSRRAGAFVELEPYVLGIEPLDVTQTANVLEQALDLPAEDRAARATALRTFVEEHDVEAWIRNQLEDLERLAESHS